MRSKCHAILTTAVCSILLSTLPAQADAVADFYRGKQITILVGFGAGGGYDTTTRMVARHFGRHVPGEPDVVVQNTPGGGSMRVANTIYNSAPQDGSVLGVFSMSVSLEPLFENPAAQFDPRKFAWIGSFHREGWSCGVWKDARPDIKSLKDLIETNKTVVFGSTGPAAPTTQHPMVMKRMLGANLRVVIGYKGTREVNLAMQQGELHATCGLFETGVRGPYRQDIEAGRLVLFTQLGREKSPAFGDAPLLYDFIQSESDRQVADLIFRQSELARPLAAPPNTPTERVAALRRALMKTMQDPGLIAEAEKINTEFNPVSGEDAVALFESLFATPPELVRKARELSEFEK